MTDERNRFRDETRSLKDYALRQVKCVEEFVTAFRDLKVDDASSSSGKKLDNPPDSGSKGGSSRRAPPGGRQGSMVPKASGGGVGMDIG